MSTPINKSSLMFINAAQALHLESLVATTQVDLTKSSSEKTKFQTIHRILTQSLGSYTLEQRSDPSARLTERTLRLLYSAITEGSQEPDTSAPIIVISDANFPLVLLKLKVLASSKEPQKNGEAKILLKNMKNELDLWESDARWKANNQAAAINWRAEMTVIEEIFMNPDSTIPKTPELPKSGLLGKTAGVAVAVAAIYLAYTNFFSATNQDA